MALDALDNELKRLLVEINADLQAGGTWSEVKEQLKDSFTFGWYDAYYAQNAVSKNEAIALIYASKATLLNGLIQILVDMKNKSGSTSQSSW